MDIEVDVAYKTETMMCIRVTLDGEDRIVVIGVTSDTKEPVMVGYFAEKNGEYVFFPSGVGWQASDMRELLAAIQHFQSGV